MNSFVLTSIYGTTVFSSYRPYFLHLVGWAMIYATRVCCSTFPSKTIVAHWIDLGGMRYLMMKINWDELSCPKKTCWKQQLTQCPCDSQWLAFLEMINFKSYLSIFPKIFNKTRLKIACKIELHCTCWLLAFESRLVRSHSLL